MQQIPYAKQNISPEDIHAVINILESDWLTQGPAVKLFEEKVAAYCGAKYAVAVNSATSALHIAALAAGVGPGDRVWTSPNTFVASANCAIYCGAEVDFVDIDKLTYNIDVADFEEKLKEASSKGQLPKIVIPVHFSGQSCQMAEIAKLAQRYGVRLIEDASHAIGGHYRGQKIGACSFSDMTVFSFHPVKIITTGEGGIITTNNQELYNRLLLLRSHGITRDLDSMTEPTHGPWYYQQIDLGFNYRLSDVLAALGISQLERIDNFIERRQYLASRYNEYLYELPITLPWQHPDTYSSFHLYVVRLQLDKLRSSHVQVFNDLRNAGIGVNLHYIPVHTQPFYRQRGFNYGDFPKAEQYYSEAISLPIYYGLSDEEQDQVISSLKMVLR